MNINTLSSTQFNAKQIIKYAKCTMWSVIRKLISGNHSKMRYLKVNAVKTVVGNQFFF